MRPSHRADTVIYSRLSVADVSRETKGFQTPARNKTGTKREQNGNKAGTDGPSTRKEQNGNKFGAGQENKTGTKREQTVAEEQNMNKTGTNRR